MKNIRIYINKTNNTKNENINNNSLVDKNLNKSPKDLGNTFELKTNFHDLWKEVNNA